MRFRGSTPRWPRLRSARGHRSWAGPLPGLGWGKSCSWRALSNLKFEIRSLDFRSGDTKGGGSGDKALGPYRTTTGMRREQLIDNRILRVRPVRNKLLGPLPLHSQRTEIAPPQHLAHAV